MNSETHPFRPGRSRWHGILAAACALALLSLGSTQLGAQAAPGGAAAGGGRAGGGGGGFGGRGSVGTPGLGAPAIDLYAAGVAGSRARGNTALFNDLEWTAITRMELQLQKQSKAVTDARDALSKATYELPVDQANIAAKAESLATAELALALARADAFPKLKADLKLSPDRVPDFIAAVSQ